MKLNVFKKLFAVTFLACSINSLLASEITLIYESEDNPEPISATFALRPGEKLTHEKLAHVLKKYFNFTDTDLDYTTVALNYEDGSSRDIFVDLETTGEIKEFTPLLAEGADLALNIIKDYTPDMTDDASAISYSLPEGAHSSDMSDDASAISYSLPEGAHSSDMSDDESTIPSDSYEPINGGAGAPAPRKLIQVIYDSPIKQEQCEYIYDADKYGYLTYSRLNQILVEHCNVPKNDLKHCAAGLKMGKDFIPIDDANPSNAMKPILGLKPGSTIVVFNWKI